MELELLKEINLLIERENLDRHGEYGYWIDPENGLNPVKMFGHDMWVIKRGMKNFKEAFANGFVRIIHQKPHQVSIEGRPQDIHRAARVLMPSTAAKDVEQFTIVEVADDGSQMDHAHNTFMLPKQRKELQFYLMGKAIPS